MYKNKTSRVLVAVTVLILIFSVTACEKDEEGVYKAGDFEFYREYIGDLSFLVPSHWATFIPNPGDEDALLPIFGSEFSAWYPEFENEPNFTVNQFNTFGVLPTDEEMQGLLLMQTGGKIDIESLEWSTVIDPVNALFLRGVIINEDSVYKGMKVIDISFVYNDWIYFISAVYDGNEPEQDFLINYMIDSLNLAIY